jgi:hypothetical protein
VSFLCVFLSRHGRLIVSVVVMVRGYYPSWLLWLSFQVRLAFVFSAVVVVVVPWYSLSSRRGVLGFGRDGLSLLLVSAAR